MRFLSWQKGILEALYVRNNYPNNRVLRDAEDCLSVPVDKIRSWYVGVGGGVAIPLKHIVPSDFKIGIIGFNTF